MDQYTLEQVGNTPVRFHVSIDNPESSTWTATSTASTPLHRANSLLPLRIVEGPRAGAIAVGLVSSDGLSIRGRRPFQQNKVGRIA
jgi:hypothetical protein